MSNPESIIFAFISSWKAADAISHPILFENFFSAGQYFVRISLMADIENKFILWSIEDVVHAHDQFHSSKAGGKVTWIGRAALYHIMTDFSTERFEFLYAESFDIRR